MRSARRHLAFLTLLVATSFTTPPSHAAELYLSGDIGISSLTGDGDGFNDVVGVPSSGTSSDSSPVWGGALGIAFPLNAALPWRMRMPDVRIPYFPGKAIEFAGSEDFRLPDWDVRFEVEHLRGRDFELSTDGVNELLPYRSDVSSWSVMAKLRLDVPVRAPINAVFGRFPMLDPLSIYAGGGAGIGETELRASDSINFGSETATEFAYQINAGLGYQLSERVKWSVGWRFYDLGEVSTDLTDGLTQRGSYSIDLAAHEFTTALHFTFWRVPFLGDE